MLLLFSCRKATQLMSDQLERRLRLPESLGLAAHLRMCAPCRRYRGQLHGLMELLREQKEWVGKEQLSAEARERMEKMLAEGGGKL